MASQVPIEYLRERFSYDPDTGVLAWRNGQRAGQEAGRKGNHQAFLRFNGRRHSILVHRIAFALMTGRWPPHDIDHRNGISTDNRWDNLRAATRAENTQNLGGPYRNGSTGVLGVHRIVNRLKPWRARIGINGGKCSLGCFPTKEEAYQAYLRAKKELHPFSERVHG
jgi:hypothetical protein